LREEDDNIAFVKIFTVMYMRTILLKYLKIWVYRYKSENNFIELNQNNYVIKIVYV